MSASNTVARAKRDGALLGRCPEGKRMAFVVTVDFFDTLGILMQEPRMAGRDKSLSVWQYGATRGIDRVLGVSEY